MSRIGFLFFMVMAFAQPFIPAEEKELQNHVQIYLDNSYSMSNEVDEDLSGMDAAIEVVNGIIDQYPSGTRFRLLTNDFESFSTIFRSGEEIREIMTELRPSRLTRESGQILKRLKGGENLSIIDTYWISDFQSSLYTEILEDSIAVRLVPLVFQSTRNIFIDSVYAESPFTTGEERLKLFARLVNRGEREAVNLNLKFFVNDIQVTTNSIDVPANGSVLTEFDVAFSLSEVNECKISFEDFPVSFDNDFYFILNNQRRLKIVEIQGSTRSATLNQVFGNRDLFEFESFPRENLDYNAVRNADFVVLNQVENPDNSLVLLMGEYLDSFGKLFVIPSKNMDINSYEQLLGGIALTIQDSSIMREMSLPDFNNPFFNDIFEDRNQGMKMPEARTHLMWYLDRDAYLKLPDGTPFLGRIDRGGQLFLLSSPLTTEFTNFHLHALFVPVMYKLAMTGTSLNTLLYSTLKEQEVRIPLDSTYAIEVLKLSNGVQEIIPQHRMNGNELIVSLPPTEISTGFYKVSWDGNELNRLAFNHDQRESDLEQLTSSQIASVFSRSGYELFEEYRGEGIQNVIYARYQPIALWKYALILSLIFLIIEILLFKLMK